MKYHQLVSSNIPTSLQVWLADELESRGIDGAYTRYILSLLQQDPVDLEPNECNHFNSNQKHVHSVGNQFVAPFSKTRHRGWKNWNHDRQKLQFEKGVGALDLAEGEIGMTGDNNLVVVKGGTKSNRLDCQCSSPICLDTEEMKKSVAVECLKSASEEKHGIEKLIDEVCIKLKNFKADSESPKCLGIYQEPMISIHRNALEPSFVKETIELYDAAFPALTDSTDSNFGEEKETSKVWDHPNKILFAEEENVVDEKPSSDGESNSSDSGIFPAGHEVYDFTSKELNPNLWLNEAKNEVEKGHPTYIDAKLGAPFGFFAPSLTFYSSVVITSREVFPPNGDENGSASVEREEKYHIQPFGNDGFSSSSGSTPVNEDSASPIEPGFYPNQNLGDSQSLEDPESPVKGEDRDNQALVTDLIRKFDTNLAAIWGAEVTNEKDSVPLLKELLLQNVNEASNHASVLSQTPKNLFANSKSYGVWTNLAQEPDDIRYRYSGILDSSDGIHSRDDGVHYGYPGILTHDDGIISRDDNFKGSVFSITNLFESTDSQGTKLEGMNDPNKCLSLSLDEPIILEDEALPDESISSEISSLGNKSDPDGVERILFLAPDEFIKETANEYSSTETSERGSDYANWLLAPTKDARTKEFDGLGSAVYNLWEKPGTSPANTKFGNFLVGDSKNGSVWSTSDTSDKVADWIANHCLVENKYPKEDYVVEISNHICGFTHHEGSQFKELIPKTLEHCQAENVASGIPKVESEDLEPQEDEEENLLTSPRTHFIPICPDSGDSDGNEDIDAIVTALEQSTTKHVKAKKNDEKNPGAKPSMAKERKPPLAVIKEMLILSAPLAIEDLERSQSLDEEGQAVLKAVQSGWKSSILRDQSTNTESHICAPTFVREPLATIQETTAFDEQDGLGIPFLSKIRIWGNDSLHGNDDAVPSLGLDLDFPQHWSWSTSDDTDEIQEMSDYHHLKLDELISSPDPEQFNEESHTEADVFVDDDLDLTLVKKANETKEANDNQLNPDKLFTLIDKFPSELCLAQEEASFCLAPSTYKKEATCADDLFKEAYKPLDETEGHEPFYGLEEQFGNEIELPAIPTNNAMYSTELEDEWHRLSQSFDVKFPPKSKTSKLGEDWHSSPHRRPCSFYLEGNCRRSDCKFEHDLDKITCRFWVEGSCFKGVTCPFLHGYWGQREITPIPFSPLFKDKTCSVASPILPKWNFKLESEKDFPSLSASSNQDSEVCSLPLTLSEDPKKSTSSRRESGVGRVLRPKKSKKSFSNQLPISFSSCKKQDGFRKKNSSKTIPKDLSFKE